MKLPKMSHGRRVCAGFGLLEAIVALVLLATVGAAMFDWIAHNIRQVSRVEEVERRARLQLDAQSLLAGVDPIAMPEGRMARLGISVSWRARPLREPRALPRLLPDGTVVSDRWAVGLYELQIRATQPDPQDRTSAALPPAEVEFTMMVLGLKDIAGR